MSLPNTAARTNARTASLLQLMDDVSASSCESGTGSDDTETHSQTDQDATASVSITSGIWEEPLLVCAGCGVEGEKVLVHHCQACGLLMPAPDLAGIDDKNSYYTSCQSSYESYIDTELNRRQAYKHDPTTEESSFDYDADIEPDSKVPTPTGSVVMQVITPRIYVPQDIAEKLAADEEAREQAANGEVVQQPVDAHMVQQPVDAEVVQQAVDAQVVQQAADDDVVEAADTDDDEEVPVGDVVQKTANTTLVQEQAQEEDVLSQDLGSYIKEPESGQEADVSSDSSHSSDYTGEDARAPKDAKQEPETSQQPSRTMRKKRVARRRSMKEPIDYERVCESLIKPDVEVVTNKKGEHSLSKCNAMKLPFPRRHVMPHVNLSHDKELLQPNVTEENRNTDAISALFQNSTQSVTRSGTVAVARSAGNKQRETSTWALAIPRRKAAKAIAAGLGPRVTSASTTHGCIAPERTKTYVN